VRVRDPIHGTLAVSDEEKAVIDSRFFQRLRHVRQLGFGELAFPGATHTRHAHALGAMHVASRLFDVVADRAALSLRTRERFRASVRLAMLCHDLGHMPLSHASESIAPARELLKLPAWIGGKGAQASHEDFTVRILLDSSLTPLVRERYGSLGVQPEHVVALITAQDPPSGSPFVDAGADWSPLLRALVSGELDADRMDYLRRDAYYSGVSYGNFDHQWLVGSVTAVPFEGRYALTLQHKGVWAFENFLLARLHMFLAVYYHHTATCFDHMLLRFYESGAYDLPASADAYLERDDVHLWTALRASHDPWAQQIVRRKPYRLLVETHDFANDPKDLALDSRLREAGVDFFRLRSSGVLSKYFKRRDEVFPLLVLEPEVGRLSRIEDYTPLYRRFSDVVGVSRVFCRPDQLDAARRIVAS